MPVISVLTRYCRHLPLACAIAVLMIGCPKDDHPNDSPKSGDNGPIQESDDQVSGGEDLGDRTGDNKVCGLEVLPTPSAFGGNPCTSGELLFADTFHRDNGQPTEQTRTVEVPYDGHVCVTVDNGGFALDGDADAHQRVRAGWIFVDGELEAGPDQFGRGVDQVQRTFDVSAGSHDVGVTLGSGPEARIGVEVRAVERGASHAVTMGENGSLEVTNVAVDHPMFSPNDDGYHDDALLHADNFAHDLPGKETGEYEYAIEWSWEIINADTCESVEVVLSGTEQVNSPAKVEAYWDGKLDDGSTVADGTYIYRYSAKLIRSDGLIIDQAIAEPHALLVDSREPSFEGPQFGGSCDPAEDPYDCRCPEDSLEDGTRCTFAWIPYLDSPRDADFDASHFITSHFDEETDRWQVVVDLRQFNGGGLVPQSEGVWESHEQLQQFIADLTGVPADPDGLRLFNFDYIQLGYSTPVVDMGSVDGFNHFLLDAMTDSDGRITIDGQTIDVAAKFESGEENTPAEFQVRAAREGDECGYNGNSDGKTKITAKSCSKIRTANLDPQGSALGVYHLETAIFDFERNGVGTTRDEHCIINGTFKCGVRTFHREAGMKVTADQFTEHDGIRKVADDHAEARGITVLKVGTDRLFAGATSTSHSQVLDGICVRGIASADNMTIPLDSATGAVPSSCIINGTF